MSGNLVSKVTIVKMLSQISYDFSWTGSPTGTFNVQVSNSYTQDESGNVANPGTWDNLPLSAPTNATGSAGNGFVDIFGTGSYAMRVTYTAGSGSGTLTVTINAKVA
jgi:hypothetical protein